MNRLWSPGRSDAPNEVARVMRQWYEQGLGNLLLQQERREIASLLPNLFGYHLLQVGYLGGCDLLAQSPIRHCLAISADLGAPRELVGLYALPGALPVASDSVDVVILPHTLELDVDPHQVLREADRVLIPEGHVVVLGFNPWSLWGVRRFVAGWRGDTPWRRRFLRPTRVKDWLGLLGFDIVETRNFFYRPPFHNERLMTRLQFVETLGSRAWPWAGGAYVIVARKRVSTLTPIRPRWRRPRLVTPELAGSTHRKASR